MMDGLVSQFLLTRSLARLAVPAGSDAASSAADSSASTKSRAGRAAAVGARTKEAAVPDSAALLKGWDLANIRRLRQMHEATKLVILQATVTTMRSSNFEMTTRKAATIPATAGPETQQLPKLKVGIVGAGMAGLYAALMLQTTWVAGAATQDVTFELLESDSHRVGGRGFTYWFNGEQGMEAEPGTNDYLDYFDVGAMRLPVMDFNSTVIGDGQAPTPQSAALPPQPWPLVQYLNARLYEINRQRQTQQLPQFDYVELPEYHFTDYNTSYLFNDQLKRRRDFTTIPGQYRTPTAAELRFDSSNNPAFPALFDHVTVDDVLSPIFDEWNDAFNQEYQHNNQRSVTVTLRRLFDEFDHYSMRTYLTGVRIPAMARDLGGSVTDDQASAVVDWLESVDSGSSLYFLAFTENVLENYKFTSAQFRRIGGGTSRLAIAMERVIRHTAQQFKQPDPIKFSHRVTKLEALGQNGQPVIDPQQTARLRVQCVEQPDRVFDYVIFTVPLGVARTIDMSGMLGFGKRQAMRVLAYDHAVKVGLRFKSKWWMDPKFMGRNNIIVGGQAASDLPVRTVVYPSLPNDPTSHIKEPGILMASYCWAQDAARLASMPHREVVDVCLNSLQQLHPTVSIAGLYDNQYFVHSWYHDNRTRGAYAYFQPGQFAALYPSIIAPECNDHLYFAGEICSINHAWIMGAVNSAQRAVAHMLIAAQRMDLHCAVVAAWGFAPDDPQTCEPTSSAPAHSNRPKRRRGDEDEGDDSKE